jgi:hypothetical protein
MGKNSGFQVPTNLFETTVPEGTDDGVLVTDVDLAGVTDLASAEQAVTDEATTLADVEDPTDEQLDRLDALVALADRIREEGATRTQASDERRERARKAKERLAGPTGEGEGGDEPAEEPAGEETPEGDETPAEETPAEEPAEETPAEESIAASGKRGGRTPGRRAPSLIRGRSNGGRTPARRDPQPADRGRSDSSLVITAAAGVRNVEAGSELSDMDAMVEAFMVRAGSHPAGNLPDQYHRHPVANISRGDASFAGLIDTEFDNDLALLDAAADEKRLVGKNGQGGSLAAAGGWCAPSETLYDFVALETNDGLYDMPEVGVKRGGLNLTMGPDFGAIYADSGFTQTEAQAIAGDTKNCYSVPCPDFDETRLDAIGLCIKNGFLTNTAYPELVRRVLSGALVAHEHKKSIKAVNAVASELGTAVTLADSGSTARNILTGLELAAEGQRNLYRMGVNTTMEVVLPHWTRAAIRDDLQSRLRQVDPVTDAQLDAHFAARMLRVQFIYGFGDAHVVAAEGSNTLVIAFPATFPALIYPAGTFIKGVADVINLDTVYDSTDLEVNVYTAAFIEEAMLVARRAPGGGRLTIPTNQSGRVGLATLPVWATQA